MVTLHEAMIKKNKALKLVGLVLLTLVLTQSCGSLEKCNCPGGKKSLASVE